VNLSDRSAIVNNVELYQEDIARIYNLIQFESGQTTSSIECSIQCTFPDASFTTGPLDALFEQVNSPKMVDSMLISVVMCNQETRSVSVYASSEGVYLRVQGGGEIWNKGFFSRLVESVKTFQRPSIIVKEPRWRWLAFGLFFFVELLSSASGISSYIRTSNPVAAIIGVGGAIVVGYLVYLSYKWSKEYTALRMRSQPCTIAIARRPNPMSSSSGSNAPNPPLHVGLGIVGAITVCISAAVAIATTFLKL
jgi:hypothetical protein